MSDKLAEERAREVLADVLGYRPDSAQRVAFMAGNLIPIIFPEDAIAAMLAFAKQSTVSVEGERVEYSPIDDEINRAFIDGWNARLEHDDFDMALHFWMLAGVTHIGDTDIRTAPQRAGEGK